MNDARAITADFASLKWINGRKVLQIICEVPSERAEEVLAKLGNPTNDGIPVAIAVLEIQPDVKKDLADKAEKAKRNFEDLPYSQQAALLCKDERFYEILYNAIECRVLIDSDNVAEELRNHLDIKSRSELDDVNNTFARIEFKNLRNACRADIGLYPEQRG